MTYHHSITAQTAHIAASAAQTIHSIRMVLSHAHHTAQLRGPEVANVH